MEDLVARREELEKELAEIVKGSDGWLREEIEDRVVTRFKTLGFLMRQFVRREPLTALLAEAREPFKDRMSRLATNDERMLLIRAIETSVTIRRIDALIYLHKLLRVWIAPHVVSTSIMLTLMIVHVIQVVYFAV